MDGVPATSTSHALADPKAFHFFTESDNRTC
jgi:hypothetical protein